MRSWFRGRRTGLAIATALVIGIGLTTRLPGIDWGPLVGKYLGSLLWGAMVYCLVGFMRPRWQVSGVALVAACIAVSVELSQLWHTPWLDGFRQTRLGVLLIGRFFAWADIAAYLVGIAISVGADRLVSRLNETRAD
ncbi:DUF2809 domain-containing protein [Bosea sp. UNC402CLCol]|uniref:ribosomal maturation YjgA family protein n=1 Tax=Bosea sp. UNC402CLCol TaxID=1510531 RepID=UPI00056F68F4|nr:DUF2809 domain-containing protein [Bosea sp. UNC402CLCol]